jgi:hypothetical protein
MINPKTFIRTASIARVVPIVHEKENSDVKLDGTLQHSPFQETTCIGYIVRRESQLSLPILWIRNVE